MQMDTDVRESIRSGKRLGIMGGTFDPIHYGHLVAAETARVEFELDYVLFIPTGIPPHKVQHRVTQPELRYAMVKMSIQSNPNFKISRMEIDRQGPAYTIDTLRELHQVFPEQELFFITGTDALTELMSWREPEEIIRLARVIGVSRPGYDARGLAENYYRCYPSTRERIFQLEIPALAISSTDIRERVSTQKSIRYLLPDGVRSFIEESKLYQDK